MKEFKYVIKDEIGIHARPAGMLGKAAKAFTSNITITAGEKTVAVTKLMGVMQLGVKQGTEVVIRAEGADEEAAIAAMEAFMNANL